uniref:Uncharacterized protein n=1 Tax=Anguilla anguilla TaxID=7936 RepID=A0A0E9SV51_ANGAN
MTVQTPFKKIRKKITRPCPRRLTCLLLSIQVAYKLFAACMLSGGQVSRFEHNLGQQG